MQLHLLQQYDPYERHTFCSPCILNPCGICHNKQCSEVLALGTSRHNHAIFKWSPHIHELTLNILLVMRICQQSGASSTHFISMLHYLQRPSLSNCHSVKHAASTKDAAGVRIQYCQLREARRKVSIYLAYFALC